VVAEKCGKSLIFHISCGRIAVFEVMRSCCRFGISLFAFLFLLLFLFVKTRKSPGFPGLFEL